MKRRLLMIAMLGIALGVASMPSGTFASQDKGKAAEKSGEGRRLFQRYCASCHGSDGKGGGPVAKNLKTAPPDLTRIPKVDGKFPAGHVQEVIQGETMSSTHGTREMPVWGSVFRRQAGEGFAKLDIYNLTHYIESIQSK